MHRQLDQHMPGVTHQTQRSGSPYTLVVRKTQQAVTTKQQDKRKKLMTLSRLYRILERNCVKLAMYARMCGTFKEHGATALEPEAKRPRMSSSAWPRGCN